MLAISLLVSVPMNTYAGEMGTEASSYSSVAGSNFSYENIVGTITDEEEVKYEYYNVAFISKEETENKLKEYAQGINGEIVSSEIYDVHGTYVYDDGELVFDTPLECQSQIQNFEDIYRDEDGFSCVLRSEVEDVTYTDGESQSIYQSFLL